MQRTLPAAAIAVMTALSLVACSNSDSGPAIDQVRASGVLRVGTEGTYTPFSYQGADGQLTGYDVDVVRAIGDKLGVSVEFTQSPWDSLFAGLEAGRFDLVANQVAVSDERIQRYDLSTPYTFSEGVIITRADDTSITSVADLDGKTAAQAPACNWAQVARDAGANVETVSGFVQAIMLLKNGRVDATVNDNLAIDEYENRTGDASLRMAAYTGDTSEQAFAASKGSGLVPDIDQALDELRADGILAQISEKYFGSDVSSPTD
ncbi:amino acid ABC transporter substrate-binding protein [Rhodococcus sp. NPDC049939]|uniref:amino acid ABC transporter substrate-binding protein n=1 Tax=Rhodococcus sp. NPDC049939 TaxID=3155511 RepID=UPI0033FBD85F